jgi:hypothetical protein
MTRTELLNRWAQRAEEFQRVAAMVNGHRVISELIAELEILFREEESEILTLEQAADNSGYSVDHLARSLRSGAIPNAGRKGQPRVRRGDLPRKPTALRNEMHEPILAVNTRRQIAQSVVTSTHERHDG